MFHFPCFARRLLTDIYSQEMHYIKFIRHLMTINKQKIFIVEKCTLLNLFDISWHTCFKKKIYIVKKNSILNKIPTFQKSRLKLCKTVISEDTDEFWTILNFRAFPSSCFLFQFGWYRSYKHWLSTSGLYFFQL